MCNLNCVQTAVSERMRGGLLELAWEHEELTAGDELISRLKFRPLQTRERELAQGEEVERVGGSS